MTMPMSASPDEIGSRIIDALSVAKARALVSMDKNSDIPAKKTLVLSGNSYPRQPPPTAVDRLGRPNPSDESTILPTSPPPAAPQDRPRMKRPRNGAASLTSQLASVRVGRQTHRAEMVCLANSIR